MGEAREADVDEVDGTDVVTDSRVEVAVVTWTRKAVTRTATTNERFILFLKIDYLFLLVSRGFF